KLQSIDAYTYVILGDGECAEGSVFEAAAAASKLELDNLIAIVDMNRLGQSGESPFAHDTEKLSLKFKSCGCECFTIDGHSIEEIKATLQEAKSLKNKKPKLIIAKTYKGHGFSGMENKDNWHGKPIKDSEVLKNYELGKFKNFSLPSVDFKSQKHATSIK
ncbi:MAG: hypothetical protein MHPSP_003541, partial [Paramarteilia canceri]